MSGRDRRGEAWLLLLMLLVELVVVAAVVMLVVLASTTAIARWLSVTLCAWHGCGVAVTGRISRYNVR